MSINSELINLTDNARVNMAIVELQSSKTDAESTKAINKKIFKQTKTQEVYISWSQRKTLSWTLRTSSKVTQLMRWPTFSL